MGFLIKRYGFISGCKDFSMVHGCFAVYGCYFVGYGCVLFLCHPPTPTIGGTNRIYILQLLLLSKDRHFCDLSAEIGRRTCDFLQSKSLCSTDTN